MNVIIVEDDKLLRKWLSMLLSTLKEYDLTIYEASDGVEALELLKQTSLDLVFTDIKMPRMDGLQLIQQLREQYPRIRIVVLSAYDEFSYAKTAMQYGALDYFLKAELTINDLSALMDKVQKDFQMESKLSSGSTPDYAAIMQVQKELGEFLAAENQPAPPFLQQLSLPSAQSPILLTMLQLQNPNELEIPIWAVANICKRTLCAENFSGTAIPYKGNGCLLVYCCSENVEELRKIRVDKLCGVLCNHLNKYLGLSVEFEIHQTCREQNDLRHCIHQIYQTAAQRKYYGTHVRCTENLSVLPPWKDQIRKALEADRYRDAAACLQATIAAAHQVQLTPELLRNELMSVLNMFLSRWDQKNAFACKNAPHNHLHLQMIDALRAETRQQLDLQISAFLNAFVDVMQQDGNVYSPAVRNAITYAEQHYAEKLSLDDVVGFVFMNRSYFCQVFKKETGVTFGDYVEHMRIEKAQKFLETTSWPVMSVAEKTGFQNQAYFTKVFKSVTGVSPLRYRKIHYQG